MKSANLHNKLIEGYFEILKHLDSNDKLDLIAKLSQSIKTDQKAPKSEFKKAFGAWDKKDSAEDLINTIKKSRSINRNIEEL
jgi:hypothetical protein